jgi:hypothetical protein
METLSVEDNLSLIESHIQRIRRLLASGKKEEAFAEVVDMGDKVTNLEDLLQD